MTDERRTDAVNGRTQVTERRQPRPAEPRPARARPAGPRPARTRPATAPPVPRRVASRPASYRPASPRTAPARPGQRTAPESRTRFVFLIVGLLGVGARKYLMVLWGFLLFTELDGIAGG